MITIVDYGVGNLGSIVNMISHVGGTSCISADPEKVAAADKLILPGVGHFDHGMAQLVSRDFVAALDEARTNGAWILGICLGMQLMTRRSDEGDAPGLGWFDLDTRRFLRDEPSLMVPHMGWNQAAVANGGCELLPEDVTGARFYFVHSYYVDAAGHPACVCISRYGGISFASGIRSGRLFGFQFHPEKSHRFGMAMLQRFSELPEQ